MATLTDLLYLPDHTDPTRAKSSESDDLGSVVGDGARERGHPSQNPGGGRENALGFANPGAPIP